MTMVELAETHSLRDTEVAYTVPCFRVNTIVPALVVPILIKRDLKSSIALMTFTCEIDFINKSKARTSRENHR
jgi:hypothetical protein